RGSRDAWDKGRQLARTWHLFEGERDAVQPAAQLDHWLLIRGGEGEPRAPSLPPGRRTAPPRPFRRSGTRVVTGASVPYPPVTWTGGWGIRISQLLTPGRACSPGEAPGAGSAGRGSHGRRSLTATATTTPAAQA